MQKYMSLMLALLFGMSGFAFASDATTDASAKLYAAKCAMCHGKDFKGNPAMAKMFKLETSALSLVSADVQGKKDADLVTLITKGKNKMPAFETKLKPEEITGLVTYIRSVAPKSSDSGK